MSNEQIETTIKSLTPEQICRVLGLEYPIGHVFEAGLTVTTGFAPSLWRESTTAQRRKQISMD